MQQPVHLREMLSAARHAKQYGMKEGEFINFAAKAFAIAELRHQNIGNLFIYANENPKHDLAARNETTEMDVIEEIRFVSNELKSKEAYQNKLRKMKNLLLPLIL